MPWQCNIRYFVASYVLFWRLWGQIRSKTMFYGQEMHHTGGTGKWVCKICNYAPKWRICRELANTCPTNEKEALLHLPSATLMYVCTVKVHFQNISFQPSDRFHRLDFSSILRNMAVQWFEWKSKMNGDIRTEECQDRYHSIWAPHFSHTLNCFYTSEYDFRHWGQTVFHLAWLAFNKKVKAIVVKTLRLLSFVICRKQRDTGCLHQSLAFSCSRRVSPTISTLHRSRTVYFQSILVIWDPSHIFINFWPGILSSF